MKLDILTIRILVITVTKVEFERQTLKIALYIQD